MVGTKLGTVGTVAAGPHNSSHMSELPTSPQRDPESCDELRNMLCPRQGVKNGGGWGVVRYDNRSTNFCRLLGSCSRFEQLFSAKAVVFHCWSSITDRSVSPVCPRILQVVWNWGQPSGGLVYTDGKMLPPPSLDRIDTNWAFRQVSKNGVLSVTACFRQLRLGPNNV